MIQKIKFYQVKMPQKSHVCKLSLWLLYYHMPINTLTTFCDCYCEDCRDKVAVLCNVYESYAFEWSIFFFFLRWPEADSKVDFESSANPSSLFKIHCQKPSLYSKKKIWNACWYTLTIRLLPLLQWKICSTLSCLWRLFDN